MSFGRAVAIGKMTVKNLASAERVLGVKFTAPDKKVTGRSYVDMTAGTIKEYGYPGNFAGQRDAELLFGDEHHGQ